MSRQGDIRPGRTITLAVLVVCFMAIPGRLLAAGPAVRVLVAEGRASLTVASGGGLTATDASGRRILARRA
ncbi:MAG TPA: hypothetical protein VN203_11385, partial [Candidatus Acidoferrum sp.]|nr:hypothetical protein [Candidatus Acidoferrum sp.]